MIELRNWSFTFYGNEIVADSTLSLQKGHLALLLGQNGMGKSSFLHSLFFSNHRGELLFLQKEISKLSATQASYLPQKYHRSHGLSLENMAIFSLYAHKNGQFNLGHQERIKLQEWLDFFKLKKPLETSFMQLSGGEQQKVMLAISFMTPTSLLLLDEPTASLDPGIEKIFLGAIEKWLGEGKAAIICTHDPYLFKATNPELWGIKNGLLKKISWDQVEGLYD